MLNDMDVVSPPLTPHSVTTGSKVDPFFTAGTFTQPFKQLDPHMLQKDKNDLEPVDSDEDDDDDDDEEGGFDEEEEEDLAGKDVEGNGYPKDNTNGRAVPGDAAEGAEENGEEDDNDELEGHDGDGDGDDDEDDDDEDDDDDDVEEEEESVDVEDEEDEESEEEDDDDLQPPKKRKK